MESAIKPSVIISSSSSSSSSAFPIFFPRRIATTTGYKFPHFSLSVSKGHDNEADPGAESKGFIEGVPVIGDSQKLSFSSFSKDAAMGLVLSAATGRGWTTGSGMEGPPIPVTSDAKNVSTFPWSLFTKSPRRRMLVAFTCNVCGQRTTRAINPHAYSDGTVFVQCCGCSAFHKLVDNLNLFHEMNCYVDPSFSYRGNGWEDMNFKNLDVEEGNDDHDDNIFPIE